MKKFGKHYGKIAVRFKTESLLHIGDGSEEWFEESKNRDGAQAKYAVAGVITNKQGAPFIPGTSLAGVFRSYIGKADRYFGDMQYERSSIWFSDSSPLECGKTAASAGQTFMKGEAEIRKRTKVDPRSGAGDAEARALFAKGFVPKGSKGGFEIEFWAKTREEADEIENDLKSAIRALDAGAIRIGADTTNGAGRIGVSKAEATRFDFTGDDRAARLAEYIYGKGKAEDLDWASAPLHTGAYELEITGRFVSGYISGSDTEETQRDGGTKDVRVSVKNKQGNYVIAGSSVKGVLRHHCERILNTVKGSLEKSPEAYLNALFGYVDEETRRARKGSVFVDDTVLAEASDKRMRARTPIDRFTQGVIDAKLMTYRPINAKDVSIAVSLRGALAEDGFSRRLLKLACEEIARGRIAVGGMGSVGNGYFSGEAREA